MAPTETLAEQHFATIQSLLPGELGPARAADRLDAGARGAPDLRGKLASGELSLVVGTHALIEEAVAFARARRSRSSTSSTASACASGPRSTPRRPAGRQRPHVLHMTATPIPRTLALAGYGDLDFTLLRELPARPPADPDVRLLDRGASARGPTSGSARSCAPGARRSSSARWSRSPSCCRRARRRPSSSGCAAGELRDFEVVLLHGQMPPAAKQAAMAAFASGGARRARRDVGDRGRDRRAERDRDAGRGRRALRDLAAAPAAGPDRARRSTPRCACCSGPRSSPRLRALADAHRRLRAGRDRPRAARRGRAGRHSPARAGRSSASPSCPRDAELLERARGRTPSDRRRRSGAGSCPSTRCSPTRSSARVRRRGAGADPRREGRSRGRARRAHACVAPRGRATRPTPERVREALFSILGDVSTGCACSTCSPARARWRSRRCRAGPPQRDAGRLLGGRGRRDQAQPRALGLDGRGPPPECAARSSSSARTDARQYDLVFLDPPYRHASALGPELSTRWRRCSRRAPAW